MVGEPEYATVLVKTPLTCDNLPVALELLLSYMNCYIDSAELIKLNPKSILLKYDARLTREDPLREVLLDLPESTDENFKKYFPDFLERIFAPFAQYKGINISIEKTKTNKEFHLSMELKLDASHYDLVFQALYKHDDGHEQKNENTTIFYLD